MNTTEFLKNIADQFEDTDSSEITLETQFRELEEWSSLVSLSIIAMLDEEYDVQLNGNDMRSAKTFADIYNIVNNKVK